MSRPEDKVVHHLECLEDSGVQIITIMHKVRSDSKHNLQPLHAVSTYKGHVIRDTFWRLVTFLGKIRDRLVLGNKFKVAIEIFTMKLP